MLLLLLIVWFELCAFALALAFTVVVVVLMMLGGIIQRMVAALPLSDLLVVLLLFI
jgi:hypothetical protein